MSPKFVIGIGSQRAGSTLLHTILERCTPIFMHPIKELHYYDTLYGVRDPYILKDFSEKDVKRILDRLVEADQYAYINKRYKAYVRATNLLHCTPIEEIKYLDLYRPCIMHHQYLGEVTPEYMILPEEGVAKMAQDLGRDTKIILIGRDPLDRFISAVKLLKHYDDPSYDMTNFSNDIELVLETMPTWIEQQKQFNDYDVALNKYRTYFDNVLFLEYEKMVDSFDTLKTSLENFLEMKIADEEFQKVTSTKVNSIHENISVPKSTLNAVKSSLNL